jgi:VWFA-related protein
LRTHGLFFALFISLLVIEASAQIAPQSGDSPTQSSAAPTAVTSAQVLFTVSDDSGNAVPAPAKDSVRLRIDKQPVEIEEIRSLKNTPLFFSVLLDISGSSKQFAGQQIAAATRLFADLSTSENHGYLILFKSEIATSDRFISTSSVEEILRRFPPSSRTGGTALYDAIIHAAAEQLSSTKVPRNSRRAIFILSDGGDNSSHKSLEQTLKLVRSEGIPIFSLGFSRDKGSDSARELKRDLETLKTLSDSTGGFVTFLDQSGDPVQRAASLVDGQCVMLFKPPSLKPNKSYALKIESSVKGIHVFAPTEYFIP